MIDDSANQKVKLVELLAAVEPEAAKLELIGKDMIQNARLARDTAGPLQKIYSELPVSGLRPDQWVAQVGSWKSWHESARVLQSSSTNISSFGAASTAATNTAVSGVMFATGTDNPYMPVASVPNQVNSQIIQNAKTDLFHVLEKSTLVEKAVASIRRLGLDSRTAGRASPLDLLMQSRSSLDVPIVQEGGSVSVLISLRECIDACITGLINRRPHQEEAKGWKGKVSSLGRQCPRPGLPADHFIQLGVETETTMNHLSGAKQSELGRAQLTERFYQGLLFLNSLLDSIDEKVLKPS